MIMFAMILPTVAVCIHAFSYGIYLARKEKNPLAAFGTFLLTVLTAAATALMLIYKY
jgi:hypothetical protein